MKARPKIGQMEVGSVSLWIKVENSISNFFRVSWFNGCGENGSWKRFRVDKGDSQGSSCVVFK